MSGNLVKETICDVFTIGYCAATDGIKDSFFSFLERLSKEMIHRGVLDAMLIHFQPLVTIGYLYAGIDRENSQ